MRARTTASHRHRVVGAMVIVFAFIIAALTGGLASAAAKDPATWVQRFDGTAKQDDDSLAVAITPNGAVTVVTGWSVNKAHNKDYATVAYDTATGERLWVSYYNGPRDLDDLAQAIAVTPDGESVIVTGHSRSQASDDDYATVAYDVATGSQTWVSRYNGPAKAADRAHAIALTPDGATAIVTGTSRGHSSKDYATIAYDPATGAQRWLARYNGPVRGDDDARAVAITPDGMTAIVTGASPGHTGQPDYATVALDITTGARRWVARYNGPAKSDDGARSIAITNDGTRTVVTGYSVGNTVWRDIATIAYDTATGQTAWLTRYNGPATFEDEGKIVKITPDGTTAIVLGYSFGLSGSMNYATVAYSMTTGATMWVARYNGPAKLTDTPAALAVTPDGATAIVTGGSQGTTQSDFATLAYDASTGAQQWLHRYNGSLTGYDEAHALAITPDGATVVVAGNSIAANGFLDVATVAYPVDPAS